MIASVCVCVCVCSSSPHVHLSERDTFQDPQWMPETMGSAEHYLYYVFSYTYVLW